MKKENICVDLISEAYNGNPDIFVKCLQPFHIFTKLHF